MKPLIVANWKMNKTLAESVTYVQTVGESLDKLSNVQVVLCPSYVSLPVMDGLLRGSKVRLGAQDVSAKKNGAHTGEVSASMLTPHCQYAIVGHSERRKGMGETPEMVNDKIKRSVEAGLQPVVCVSNEAELEALAPLVEKVEHWIIAFEPIEAIGTGQPSDPKAVQKMVRRIKHAMGGKVLYGGSVDLENIRAYLAVSDGALVGGASLDARNFMDLCLVAADGK
jgi:triosephosphate isomerase (TIM)